jgi:ubiquinone/menaquinone biosynthesis C-methylase UbiE
MKNDHIIDYIRTPSGESLHFFRKGKNEYLESPSGVKYSFDEGIICFPVSISLTGNNKNYQTMYDRFSGYYDLATKAYALLKNGNERNRLMQYLSLLEIQDGDKVIEISIGTGRNIKYLNPKAEYFGVDISLGMLKRCQKKMKRLKREITLIQAEAESLPIKDESFDMVFSAGGFNFFNDPGKAVLEMLRIAKSGVKILISDETEKLRSKFDNNKFYKNNPIKNPAEYLPDYCKDIDYREICDGDLYVLTFKKP